jgi:hypothetical protein
MQTDHDQLQGQHAGKATEEEFANIKTEKDSNWKFLARMATPLEQHPPECPGLELLGHHI